MRRSVLSAMFAAVLAMLPTTAMAASAPEDVATWFSEQAPKLVTSAAGADLQLTTEQLERAEVGVPVIITTWAPAFRDGGATSTVLVRLDRWVAPVVLQPDPPADRPPSGQPTTGEPTPEQPTAEETAEAVGVVFARRGDAGAVTLDGIRAETELAEHLLDASGGTLVFDEQTEGWFTYTDGTIAPVTSAAREVLTGEVRAEVYQPLLAERYAERGGTVSPAPGEERGSSPPPALWAASALVTVLVFTGLVVWLRRPEQDETEAGQSAPQRSSRSGAGGRGSPVGASTPEPQGTERHVAGAQPPARRA